MAAAAAAAAASVFAAPYGLGQWTSRLAVQRSLPGRRQNYALARASSSSDSQPKFHDVAGLPPLHPHSSPRQDDSKRSIQFEEFWTHRMKDTELGKAVAPVVASAGFYLQASGAIAAVGEVEDSTEEWVAFFVAAGVSLILYFFVIPAIVYNYLRLRWYKRTAWETFFQFMLVFIFFPGMLLLAPFINFRRLPKEGTEPP